MKNASHSKSISLLAAAGLLALALAPAAPAAVVTVGSDATWTLSTTVVPDVDVNPWAANVMTAPPAVGTFTDPVVIGGGVASPAATALGVTGLNAGSDIRYYRQTFTLAPFSSVSATVDVAVDNNAAVWLNGSFVGAETTLSGSNWSDTAPPSFDIDTDGSIINVNLFDTTSPFTGFVTGTNEVIVAVRNLGAGSGSGFPTDSGGFAFRMDVTTVDAAAVPEPSTTALLGLGGLALFLRRRK